jgi:hypothetical protein
MSSLRTGLWSNTPRNWSRPRRPCRRSRCAPHRDLTLQAFQRRLEHDLPDTMDDQLEREQ